MNKKQVFLSILLLLALFIIQGLLEEKPDPVPRWQEINQVGMSFMSDGKVQAARVKFEEAYGLAQNTTIYNNLIWSSNELGDLEAAKHYIEAFESSQLTYDHFLHTNIGNYYSQIAEGEKARDHYLQAIDLYPTSEAANYGLGVYYYGQNQYEKALSYFQTSLIEGSLDEDTAAYLFYTHLYLDQEDKAMDYLDAMDRLDQIEASFERYLYMEEWTKVHDHFAYLSKQKKMEALYYFYDGKAYFEEGNFEMALSRFKETLTYESHEAIDYMTWYLHAAYQLDREEEIYQQLLATYQDEPFLKDHLHYTMGRLYEEDTYYKTAADYYKKMEAINEDTVLDVVYCLYVGDRLYQLLEVIEEAEEVENLVSPLLLWYKAAALDEMGAYEEADQLYFSIMMDYAHDLDFLDAYLWNSIARGDQEMAAELLDRIQQVDETFDTSQYEDYLALEVLDKKDLIETLFTDDYLYAIAPQKWSDFHQSTLEDTASLMMLLSKEDDYFTYSMTFQEEAAYLAEVTETATTMTRVGQSIYLDINAFETLTDDYIIYQLDQIKDLKEVSLLIDLRDNSGGYTDAANNLADAFLAEEVISTLEYRDGQQFIYYGDKEALQPLSIKILVNQETASSAELFAMALNTYLPQVEVIGQKTYGKGVGQSVHMSNTYKEYYVIVSHYWLVNQVNIHGQGYGPDLVFREEEMDQLLAEGGFLND